jgi:hypothetical protein
MYRLSALYDERHNAYRCLNSARTCSADSGSAGNGSTGLEMIIIITSKMFELCSVPRTSRLLPWSG